VTVKGVGAKETRVDANGLDRVFYLASISSETPVRFLDLTMKGGDPGAVSADSQHPDSGGALYAYTAAVAMKRVIVKGNTAETGGGLRMQATSFRMSQSTVAKNVADAKGGGILFPSALFAVPTATIRSSTIFGNDAIHGGGIAADGFGSSPSLLAPAVSLDNSTVAANDALGNGGGLLAETNAVVDLNEVTIAYNLADLDNTGGGVGGGIAQLSSADVDLGDTVIGKNDVGATGNGKQCAGGFDGTAGGILVQLQPGTACAISGTLTEPEDPGLDSPGMYGGPTKTVRLISGSPAIGLGESCPTKDQRGKARPPTACDSGAFERSGP
jgi:hypothetical protein